MFQGQVPCLAGQHPQILGPVVPAVPVEVMDHLARLSLAAQRLVRHDTLNSDRPALLGVPDTGMGVAGHQEKSAPSDADDRRRAWCTTGVKRIRPVLTASFEQLSAYRSVMSVSVNAGECGTSRPGGTWPCWPCWPCAGCAVTWPTGTEHACRCGHLLSGRMCWWTCWVPGDWNRWTQAEVEDSLQLSIAAALSTLLHCRTPSSMGPWPVLLSSLPAS